MSSALATTAPTWPPPRARSSTPAPAGRRALGAVPARAIGRISTPIRVRWRTSAATARRTWSGLAASARMSRFRPARLSPPAHAGAPALALSTTAGSWTSYDPYPRTVADVSGDGKADVVGFGGAGVWVSKSTGAAFVASTKWLSGQFSPAQGWSSFDRYPAPAGRCEWGRPGGHRGLWRRRGVRLARHLHDQQLCIRMGARCSPISAPTRAGPARRSTRAPWATWIGDHRADIIGMDGQHNIWVSLSSFQRNDDQLRRARALVGRRPDPALVGELRGCAPPGGGFRRRRQTRPAGLWGQRAGGDDLHRQSPEHRRDLAGRGHPHDAARAPPAGGRAASTAGWTRRRAMRPTRGPSWRR